ncbi:MAG: hypothetical protein OZSIB_3372 [Candidatus Ozemobacter sibiricus]|uniref:Uncharacterized protein n=1 Tax=Candidatus Ozemobacter sibiricus TaxID=2268124 RepID=A0A367ZQ76_9BACT|nr:MAG: hypothetical protein OZSIB_3372 [Candidatus Ozemobacter sibiricus]
MGSPGRGPRGGRRARAPASEQAGTIVVPHFPPVDQRDWSGPAIPVRRWQRGCGKNQRWQTTRRLRRYPVSPRGNTLGRRPAG